MSACPSRLLVKASCDILFSSIEGIHGQLLYLISIHQLIVNFDWSREGHAEGAKCSGTPVRLPSAGNITL